jgi:tetratricopeptide (TPR) repeat protein
MNSSQYNRRRGRILTMADWARIESLFQQAADLDPAARRALLDSECAGDEELRREVESLLAHDAPLPEQLTAVGRAAGELVRENEQAWIGRRFGAWEVTGVLGRGGMGAVFEVRRADGGFEQQAALKIVRSESDSSLARHRFLEERRILAQLTHPHIAALLDGGETAEGLPYLVMEKIDGRPITDYCDENALGLDERLRLFAKVCRAVQFAHQKLVIHRDIKPGNIFVTRDGHPKLLDFGIAKLIEPGFGERTATAHQALTPDYASPEQIRGEPATTATDVYGLGAVLYQLLTGRKPHGIETTSSSYELVRAICEVETPPASSVAPPALRRRLAGDLDNILAMALRKEPQRRYASAEQFAADLDNFLADRPVLARPDSRRYRAAKFLSRHRTAAAVASIAALGLVAVAAVAVYQARRAERQFANVRTLANRFLFDFHDQIRDLPGATQARELVARTALEYLDKLASEGVSDPALMLELSTAYRKVGDVFGNPYGPNLGRTRDAVPHYLRALQLAESLVSRRPGDPAALRALIEAYYGASDAQVATGRSKEALETIRKALALLPKADDPALALAGRVREAEIIRVLGDQEGAAARYEAIIREVEDNSRRDPALARLWLPSLYTRLGRAWKLANRHDLAALWIGKSIDLTSNLLRENPNSLRLLQIQQSNHNESGDIFASPFTEQGERYAEALDQFGKAQAIARRLVELDPRDHAAARSLILYRFQFAETRFRSGDRRGLAELEALIEEMRANAESNPSNVDAFYLYAISHSALAWGRNLFGDHAGALRALERGGSLLDDLTRRDPARYVFATQRIRFDAEYSHALLRLGRREEAFERARACADRAAKYDLKKAVLLELREAGWCYGYAGEAARAAGRSGLAKEWFTRGAGVYEELIQRRVPGRFIRDRRDLLLQASRG